MGLEITEIGNITVFDISLGDSVPQRTQIGNIMGSGGQNVRIGVDHAEIRVEFVMSLLRPR